MELQLAEKKGLRYTPYVWIPNIQYGGGVYVREDEFDTMSEDDFDYFMEEIAPYNQRDLGLSEGETVNLLAGFKARRAERQQARKEKKAQKVDNKKSRTEARRSRSTSKAEARKTRAEAKKTKAEGGGGDDGNDAASWRDKILDTAQSYFNKDKGADAGGGGDDGSGGGGDDGSGGKKKSNTVYWIIGGVAVAVVGSALIYNATKKKVA